MTDKTWFRLMIRTLETLLCSIIPSAVCLFILTKAPNETFWKVLCALAFVSCAVSNGFLWHWDSLNVRRNAKKFFSVNIIAYIIFIVIAQAIFKLIADITVYTAGFTSLRAFETIFKLRVSYSMMISHSIMLAEMVLVYVLGCWYRMQKQMIDNDLDK